MKYVGSFKISVHLLCPTRFIHVDSGKGQKRCNSGPEPLLISLECRALLLPRKVQGGRAPAPLWLGSLQSILCPQTVHFALSSLCCCSICRQQDSKSWESSESWESWVVSKSREKGASWRTVGFESPFPYIQVSCCANGAH